MAVNTVLFEDTIQAWLNTLLGISVIHAEGKGPRPAKPFATFKILDIAKVGRDEENVVNEDMSYKGSRIISVSVQFLGTNSTVMEYGDNVASALDHPLSKLALTVAEISVLSHSSVANVNELLEDGYEKRSAMSILFAVGSETIISSIDIIDQTNIDKTLKDAAGNVIVSDSFNIGG